MKKRILHAFLCTISVAVLFSSCVVAHDSRGGNPHGIPPGQKKKIYGTKSAKPFAPGQQKKGY